MRDNPRPWTKLVLGAFLVVGLFAPAGVAAPGDPGGPNHDFAVGSSKTVTTNGEQHYRFSAHSGPAGERPRGYVNVDFVAATGSFSGKGHVECLEVVGNRAEIRAVLDEPQPNPNPGGDPLRFIFLFVFDNGNPEQGVSPDEVFAGLASDAPQNGCASFGVSWIDLTRGNVNVHDAT